MSDEEQTPLSQSDTKQHKNPSDAGRSKDSPGLLKRILEFFGVKAKPAPGKQASGKPAGGGRVHFARLKEEIARQKQDLPSPASGEQQNLFQTLDDLSWPGIALTLDDPLAPENPEPAQAAAWPNLPQPGITQASTENLNTPESPQASTSAKISQPEFTQTSTPAKVSPSQPIETSTPAEVSSSQSIETSTPAEIRPQDSIRASVPQDVVVKQPKEQISQTQAVQGDAVAAIPLDLSDALAELERKKREIESALREHDRHEGL
jgi:hypothetical protein